MLSLKHIQVYVVIFWHEFIQWIVRSERKLQSVDSKEHLPRYIVGADSGYNGVRAIQPSLKVISYI